MSRNCWSGQAVNWLLLCLPLLLDLSSAIDRISEQNDTFVCTGLPARFRWTSNMKTFFGVIWIHNATKIASSKSLSLSPEVIISDQFKERLNFNSENPFLFTLENATQEDNGMYGCIFTFDDGSTNTLQGALMVKDFVRNDSFVEVVKKEKDGCVTLKCRIDPPSFWFFPNGTSTEAKTIRYCSNKTNETIRCERASDHVCTYAIYRDSDSDFRSCNTSEANRQKRSPGDACDDSKSDGTDPGTGPMNPVPIVLGVIAAITAIAVIIVIIVFYKRRSRNQGVQGPPVHYIPAPMEDNKECNEESY